MNMRKIDELLAQKDLTDEYRYATAAERRQEKFQKNWQREQKKIVKRIESFWSKVIIKGPDDCWEWSARKNNKGYGIFSPLKYRSAHRTSWFIKHGEIPKGMYVCHHCDNPSCVNPSHLFLGTAMDNFKDAVNKGRIKPIHLRNR